VVVLCALVSLGRSRRTLVSSSIYLSASCCGSHARFLRVKSFIAISRARLMNMDSRFQLCRPLHSLLVHSAPAHTIFLPSVVCFGLITSQDQVFPCCVFAHRLRFFLRWFVHCPMVSASVLDPAAGSPVLEPFLDFSAPILITGGCWFCLHPVLGLHSNSQLLVVANFGQLGRAVGNIFL
jgi:hypothetical protein